MPQNPSSAIQWTLSHHAALRALQRGITEEQILEILNDPQVTYTQAAYPGRQVRQRGRYAVIVAGETIVTVLYHLAHAAEAA